MVDIVQIVYEAPSLTGESGVSLTFDASQSESHDLTAEVTQRKVEEGADISDHIEVKPETLSITGVITATPLDAPSDGNRESEAWEILSSMLKSKELFTVRTSLKTYTNMALLSASASRDNLRRIAPPLTFQQVRRVRQEWVSIPPEAVKNSTAPPNTKTSATDTEEKGSQSSEKPSEEKKSWLLNMIGG